MNKEDIKDAEKYLEIRAETFNTFFEKELQGFDKIDKNYRLDFTTTGATLNFGSTLDALLLGQFLAVSILNNAVNLRDKIQYLEIIGLIEGTTELDAKNQISKVMSNIARKNAFKRHKETYELKNQAIEYWRLNIDKNLSNPKAADLLLKIVKVSHRKLVDYVAEAKRKSLPSASK